MRMFRKQEGFTLVELMVVVLIIGILVAIAIPVFNSAKANAQRRSCYANQRTIEGAVQTYAAENNGMIFGTGATGRPITPLIPTYIKNAPACPTYNASYTVDSSGTVDSNPGYPNSVENLTLTSGEVHAHY